MLLEQFGVRFLESENHKIRKFSLIDGNYNECLNPTISHEGYYDQHFLVCGALEQSLQSQFRMKEVVNVGLNSSHEE